MPDIRESPCCHIALSSADWLKKEHRFRVNSTKPFQEEALALVHANVVGTICLQTKVGFDKDVRWIQISVVVS